MTFSEEQFIRWITTQPAEPSAAASTRPAPLPVGPGDDAAWLADGTILCVDTVVEGVHFSPGTDPDAIARKALGACLSDVCAMGAVAETVLVAAQLPQGCDGQALAMGLRRWARAFSVQLAGGDTVSSGAGVLALSVTASGHLPEGCSPWLRSGAKVGDQLLVSGPLGGSRAARHLAVRPRSDLVATLRGADVPVHAAMDLSDGLAIDLPRLLEASAVGALVSGADVPIHADVPAGGDRLLAALCDGEDFELLLALDRSCTPPPGTTIIGQVTESGLTLTEGDGAQRPWPSQGFTHAF